MSDQVPEVALTVEQVADAMQKAWNDYCDDTGCFPDCFDQRGRKLYADFSRGNFARLVTDWLNAQVRASDDEATR